jgi:hypothetical protein
VPLKPSQPSPCPNCFYDMLCSFFNLTPNMAAGSDESSDVTRAQSLNVLGKVVYRRHGGSIHGNQKLIAFLTVASCFAVPAASTSARFGQKLGVC